MMGIEYYALNNRTKEIIKPFNGWKAFEIVANIPGMPEVVMHKLLHQWNGDLVVMEWDWNPDLMANYEDITAKAIADYNDEFMEPFTRCAMHPSDFAKAVIEGWASHFIFIDDPEVFIRFEILFNEYFDYLLDHW